MKIRILIVLIFASLIICDSLRDLQVYEEERPRDRDERGERRGRKGKRDRNEDNETERNVWRNGKRYNRDSDKPIEAAASLPYYGNSYTNNTNVERPNVDPYYNTYYNYTGEQMGYNSTNEEMSGKRGDHRKRFNEHLPFIVYVAIAAFLLFILWLLGLIELIRYLANLPSVRNFFGLNRPFYHYTGQQGLIITHGANCKCGHQGQVNLNQNVGQIQQRHDVSIPMTNATNDTNRSTQQMIN
jgi:hypothetical protein